MDDQQLFDVFNEEQQAEYQKEAEQLYDPAIVRATYQRWSRYTKEEKQRIGEEGKAVYREFVQAMPKGPTLPRRRPAWPPGASTWIISGHPTRSSCWDRTEDK